MADFVAVIRRAVDGLTNNTPDMRLKVYDKARGAVRRQLEGMTPRPSEDMLIRQLEKLEAAIEEVEWEYAEAQGPDAVEDHYAPPQPVEPQPVEPVPQPMPEPVPQAAQEPAPVYAAQPVHVPLPKAHFAEEPVEHEPETVHAQQEPAYDVPSYHGVQQETAAHYDQAPAARHENARDIWADPLAPEEALQEPRRHLAAQTPIPVWEEPVAMPKASFHEEPATPVAEHDHHDHQAPQWQDPEPAHHAPVYPAVEPSARTKPTDAWFDEHLEEVAATHTPMPVADHYQPKIFAPEGDVHPAKTGRAAFDDASALSDFDAFVREQAGAGHAHGVAHGEAGEAGKRADDGDLDAPWIRDFSAPPPDVAVAARSKLEERADKFGRNVNPDEMAAVLSKPARAKGKRKKSKTGIVPYAVVTVVVLALAGLGAYGYVEREALKSMVASLTSKASQTPATSNNAASATKAPVGDQQGNGHKFTQRLLPDGTEVDDGVASAQPTASGNEGHSVAQQNVASQAAVPAASAQNAAQPPAQGAAFNVPENGQKAYLYEERLGQTTPTTVQGYIVWSEQKETGDNGRAEPVIQGKLTIPEKSLTALLTFKRNTDSSLPASHLLEIVFSLGPNFDGGGIDSVQRVAMKVSEQDRGDPIVAVPAKITDDTFMVAFNDFAEVVSRNVELLRGREWIDIPVTYRNGRRGLITLDKGVTGKSVFENVVKQWAALGNAKNGG